MPLAYIQTEIKRGLVSGRKNRLDLIVLTFYNNHLSAFRIERFSPETYTMREQETGRVFQVICIINTNQAKSKTPHVVCCVCVCVLAGC